MDVYAKLKSGEVRQTGSVDGIKLEDCGLIWVDMLAPGREELDRIGSYFQIHPVALEDCIHLTHDPNVREYPDNLAITWDFLRDVPDTDRLETIAVSMFLGPNYLVTIQSEEISEIKDIRQKLINEPTVYRDHPAPILYSILDTAVDEYFPLVEEVTENVDSYMDSLLADNGQEDVKEILRLKHRNMALRRVAVTHRDVVMKLARRDMPFIPEDLSIYLLDVYDHLVRISTEVDNNADLISASLDIHLSTVSNRLNVTMKRLTAIATIFMPLTFIVGLYGMNFKYMPEYGWRYGYLVVWIVMVGLAVGMVIYARKKKWL